MKTRKLVPVLALVLTVVTSPACIFVDDDDEELADSTLTIANESSFVFEEIRVAAIDEPTFGPNLIPDLLFPGERVTVVLACDVYDVLIVDETGLECVLEGLDLCFDDALWVIDDVDLDICAF